MLRPIGKGFYDVLKGTVECLFEVERLVEESIEG